MICGFFETKPDSAATRHATNLGGIFDHNFYRLHLGSLSLLLPGAELAILYEASNLITLLAYTLSFSLLESLVVLGLVLVLCLVFPARYFKEKFIPQGSIQVVIVALLAYALRQRIEEFSKMEAWILIAIPVGVALVLVVSVLVFSWLFERFTILPDGFHRLQTVAKYLVSISSARCDRFIGNDRSKCVLDKLLLQMR